MTPYDSSPRFERPLRLSIVMPARDERESLESMMAELGSVLQPCHLDYEVIVVDDGSVDGTFEAVRELCRSHQQLRGVRLSRNFGKEAALLAGLAESSGDAVVTLDTDLQHPPAVILEMLAHWRAGARVVHGIKRAAGVSFKSHHLASATFNSLARALSGLRLKGASDFVLLDRVVVDVIIRELPERRRFFRGLTRWVGFPQAAVEFDVVSRPVRGSRWTLRGLVLLALTGLLSFSSLPLRVVTLLGVITLAFALMVAAKTLYSWFEGRSFSDFAAIEITLLFLGSSIMISLGILGEYVGGIYDEIKRRPSYLVSDRCGPRDSWIARDHLEGTAGRDRRPVAR